MSKSNSIEKYVYILGAGFSAPLGIPVMKNFLEKAKDQFSAEPDKYKHFAETFDKINQLHECAYHYDCDIGNIEEILSILLTLDNIKGTNNASLFKNFIKDVIEYYTPDKSKLDIVDNSHNTIKNAFDISPYARFVSAAFNLKYQNRNIEEHAGSISMARTTPVIHQIKRSKTNTNHSFITLNYDLVLETVLENINQRFGTKHCFCKKDTPNYEVPCLAKIHGCISDPESIIPPTWNKGDLNPTNKKAWKLAGSLLHNAHHIIIIGYSLPETDSYIKYLLKSASISGSNSYTNLKTIKVFDKFSLCRNKYASFIRKFNPNHDFYEIDVNKLFDNVSIQERDLDLVKAFNGVKVVEKIHTPNIEKAVNTFIDKRIKKQTPSLSFE